MSYTEIHFHVLPGLDDGPSSLAESVALAQAAAAEGTRTIVATPHVHPRFVTDPPALAGRVHEVNERLDELAIPIHVRCGGEIDVAMPPRLSDAQLEAIAHGPRGRRWVLLEAPLQGLRDDYTEVAGELRGRGFAITVAHPERAFKDLDAAWRVIAHEISAGSALQINAWSLAGRYGERVRATALELLRRAPTAVVASDAHGGERMPALTAAFAALARAGIPDPAGLAGKAPNALLEHGLAVRSDALAA
jgi:protein-tyrosine phosphatase